MITKFFRYTYLILIGTFLIGLMFQTYLAGLAAVARSATWDSHREFGFLLLIAGLLQLLIIFPARFPKPSRWMSGGLFTVMIVQIAALFDRESSFSALHPVMALVLFLFAWNLTGMAFQTLARPNFRDESPVDRDA